MRWFFAALVVMLVGCEGGRDVPEAGPRDQASFGQIPFVDAGTGNCEDDWSLTTGACSRLDASDEAETECNIEATKAFEFCIGANRVCRSNCVYPQIHGGDYEACLAACPADADAG